MKCKNCGSEDLELRGYNPYSILRQYRCKLCGSYTYGINEDKEAPKVQRKSDVDRALELATEKHEGQMRFSGDKFIVHPIAVANDFSDETYKIVALLHDIVEDTDVTIHDLQHKYGFSKEACIPISILTRRDAQTYLEYILKVKTDKIAIAVKLADLKHNLSDLDEGNLREKYLMARYILEN